MSASSAIQFIDRFFATKLGDVYYQSEIYSAMFMVWIKHSPDEHHQAHTRVMTRLKRVTRAIWEHLTEFCVYEMPTTHLFTSSQLGLPKPGDKCTPEQFQMLLKYKYKRVQRAIQHDTEAIYKDNKGWYIGDLETKSDVEMAWGIPGVPARQTRNTRCSHAHRNMGFVM